MKPKHEILLGLCIGTFLGIAIFFIVSWAADKDPPPEKVAVSAPALTPVPVENIIPPPVYYDDVDVFDTDCESAFSTPDE